jgi:hypothetical protein
MFTSKLTPMDIKGYGSFLYVDYEGKRYYRLSYSPLYGYNWFEYDFFTDSMQLLTNEGVMNHTLSRKLEEVLKERNAPKKLEPNTEEMFKMMLEAVENRNEFDSSKVQPSASTSYRVRVDSEKTIAYVYHQPKKDGDSYLAAAFCDNKIEIYVPDKYDDLGISHRKAKTKINKLLKAISEHFNTASYCYRESCNKGTGFHIFFKIEGEYGPYEKVMTTNPLVIPLPCAN